MDKKYSSHPSVIFDNQTKVNKITKPFRVTEAEQELIELLRKEGVLKLFIISEFRDSIEADIKMKEKAKLKEVFEAVEMADKLIDIQGQLIKVMYKLI